MWIILKSLNRILSKCFAVRLEFVNLTTKDYTPSHHKSTAILSKTIPDHLLPLFTGPMKKVKSFISTYAPVMRKSGQKIVEPSEKSSMNHFCSSIHCRLMVNGMEDKAFKHIGPAIIACLEKEKFFIQSIDLSSLLSDGVRV